MRGLRFKRFLMALGLLLLSFAHLKGASSGFSLNDLRFKIGSILKREGKKLSPQQLVQVTEEVVKLGRQYHMDPLLILAVMRVESHFDPWAHSRRGAMGLMQVRPIVWKDVGEKGRHSVIANVRVGVQYLAKLVERFDGDITKALLAYNAGPTALQRHFRLGTVPNASYQLKVLKAYSTYLES